MITIKGKKYPMREHAAMQSGGFALLSGGILHHPPGWKTSDKVIILPDQPQPELQLYTPETPSFISLRIEQWLFRSLRL